MTHLSRRCVAALLICCAGLAACSPSPNESSAEPEPTLTAAIDDPTPPAPTATAPTPAPTATSVVPTTAPETSNDDDPADPTEQVATPEPLRPTGEAQPTTVADTSPTSAYIARASMSASSIEVGWSEADEGSEYHIHRVVRTSGDEPGADAMTPDTLIHIAEGGGRFVDDGVAAGTTYWHGVQVLSADGDLMAYGWHRTAAVDDEEPPAIVDGLTAVVEGEDVLVTWTTPDENYELHSYRVLRGVNGETPEIISQTWRLDQLSFIDDEAPASGQVVYQVIAMDFHWNLSEPGSVTIALS